MTVDRRTAVEFLHERHPGVVHAPEGDVDLEALHLEFFWPQGHVCELMDRRADKAVRRCFNTIHQLLVHGVAGVRPAEWNHVVVPHLVFHAELARARQRIPRLLADLCDRVQETLVRSIDGDRPASTDQQA